MSAIRPLSSAAAVAAVCGLASVLAFEPFAGWWLMPFLLAALFAVAARAATAKRAFVVGLIFGAFFFIGGLPWVFQALSGYIGLPVAVAALLTLLFCLLLALFPAAALALGHRVSGDADGFPRVAAFAAAWTLTEWLRGWLFTGFPWLSVGYSQIPHSPLAAFAPLAGIFGVSLALCLFAACLAALLPHRGGGARRRRLAAAVVAAVLFGVAVAVPSWTRDTGETLRVSLLQANIKQSLKWQKGQLRDLLQYYLQQTQTAAGRVVVMPETALPVTADDLPDGYWQALRAAAAARDGAVLAGMFLRGGDNDNDGGADGLYNAAAAIRADATAHYGKRHLTPFGEYLPFADTLKPLLAAAGIPYFGLRAWTKNEPLPVLPGVYAGVSICYEDAFGDEWRRQLPRAHFLVNMTNDGWFDDSIMQRQHLQIAQARALETGRWLVRATNSGETAVVDWRGRVVAALPPQTRGELTRTIQLRRGATPYVKIGDMAAVAAALLLLLAARVGRLRRSRR